MKQMLDSVGDGVLGARCRVCAVGNFCYQFQAWANESGLSSSKYNRKQNIAPGEALYVHGETSAAVYLVCEGVIKTETETEDGKQQVAHFHLPGEFLGLEGMGGGPYPGSAIACSPARVCRFSQDEVFSVCGRQPDLLRKLFAGLGESIRSERYKWKLVRNEIAYYRVLFFLCDLLIRQQGVAHAGTVLLPMEKRDISSYLGMNPASLSRELSKLETKFLIKRLSQDQIYIRETALHVLDDFN